MPVGLAIPIGPDQAGGSRVIDGDEQDLKLIKISLSDGDNTNAFQQDVPLGADMVFNIEDARSKARIIRKIVEIFRGFQREKRFELKRETIKFGSGAEPGEVELEFRFLNLESDEPKIFRRTFLAGTL